MQHDGGRALAAPAEGRQAVAARQGDEEPARPRVGQVEADVVGRLAALELGEARTQALEGVGGGHALALGAGPGVQGLEAPQALGRLVLGGGGPRLAEEMHTE